MISRFPVQKSDLLQAVSFTSNGKSASPKQQLRVLQIVGKIESKFPPSDRLLSGTSEAKVLDGVWYLQYTSPSVVGNTDQFPDAWKPEFAKEGDTNIETAKFNAKGSVSAAGIPVETANRVVKQSIDVAASRVTNDVNLEWGTLCASGRFRQSPNVPNRALVSFDVFRIELNAGLVLDFGFLFPLLMFVRRSKENGWLETTFVDDEIRIGRGNKGTLFVLTRDPSAVEP